MKTSFPYCTNTLPSEEEFKWDEEDSDTTKNSVKIAPQEEVDKKAFDDSDDDWDDEDTTTITITELQKQPSNFPAVHSGFWSTAPSDIMHRLPSLDSLGDSKIEMMATPPLPPPGF